MRGGERKKRWEGKKSITKILVKTRKKTPLPPVLARLIIIFLPILLLEEEDLLLVVANPTPDKNVGRKDR